MVFTDSSALLLLDVAVGKRGVVVRPSGIGTGLHRSKLSDALIKSVWGLAILFSIVVAFFLAMHARIWWTPWAIPIAWAIIYAEAYFSERAKTSGDPQEELIAIVGLAAVGMTAVAVLLGRWAGRSRRGKQRAASSEHDSPD